RRDLRPNKPTSLPKMESATFTRKARKVSLVLLYTKTCRCSFRMRILPMSFRIELTNANLSTFVAPTSHPTHRHVGGQKSRASPGRICIHSDEGTYLAFVSRILILRMPISLT